MSATPTVEKKKRARLIDNTSLTETSTKRVLLTVSNEQLQAPQTVLCTDLEQTMKSRASACRGRSAVRGVFKESIDDAKLIHQWRQQITDIDKKVEVEKDQIATAVCARCKTALFLPKNKAVDSDDVDDVDTSQQTKQTKEPEAFEWLVVSVDRIDARYPTLAYGSSNFQLVHRLCNSAKSIHDRISQEQYLEQQATKRIDWIRKRVSTLTVPSRHQQSIELLRTYQAKQLQRWSRCRERLTECIDTSRQLVCRLAGVSGTDKLCPVCNICKPLNKFPCRRQVYTQLSRTFGQVYLPAYAARTCFDCAKSTVKSASSLPSMQDWITGYAGRFQRLQMARAWINGAVCPSLPSATAMYQLYRQQDRKCATCHQVLRKVPDTKQAADVDPDESHELDDDDMILVVVNSVSAASAASSSSSQSMWAWVHGSCQTSTSLNQQAWITVRHNRLQADKTLVKTVNGLHASHDLAMQILGLEWECKVLANQYVALQFQFRQEYIKWNQLWQKTLLARDTFETLNTRLKLTPAQFPHWFIDD